VTFATFRAAVRNPAAGLPGPFQGVSTSSIRQKAVRVFHRQGTVAARAALEQGLGGYFSQPGGPSTQAANTRVAFERYLGLASGDPRPMALLDVTTDVALGTNQVGVRIDVVLFETRGYSGRLLLWDTEPLNRSLAEVFAAPCAVGIDAVLGAGTCQTIEVWQLRHGVEFQVLRSAALAQVSEAATRLAQAVV
jgi:hypothetical protein